MYPTTTVSTLSKLCHIFKSCNRWGANAIKVHQTHESYLLLIVI